jgi:hypothetical protein
MARDNGPWIGSLSMNGSAIGRFRWQKKSVEQDFQDVDLFLERLLLAIWKTSCPSPDVLGNQDFHFEEIRLFKAGRYLNTLAWNDRTASAVLFCWFLGPP